MALAAIVALACQVTACDARSDRSLTHPTSTPAPQPASSPPKQVDPQSSGEEPPGATVEDVMQMRLHTPRLGDTGIRRWFDASTAAFGVRYRGLAFVESRPI